MLAITIIEAMLVNEITLFRIVVWHNDHQTIYIYQEKALNSWGLSLPTVEAQLNPLQTVVIQSAFNDVYWRFINREKLI